MQYGGALFSLIVMWGLLVPQLTAFARRLHDTNHSAKWLIPVLLSAA
ncbi:MAG: DUF805 domain-containing protein, partial [Terriglobales bacterium]